MPDGSTDARPEAMNGRDGAQPWTVLIDDVRSFRDGRPCLVSRSSEAGVALLDQLREQRIGDLWLDHDLVGDDDIWPVIRLLEQAADDGWPFDINRLHVHASRSLAAHQMTIALRRAGYRPERSYNLRMWCW